MLTNHILDKLPKHLIQYCIRQPYESYTCQDHAVWRYVMRQNIDFLGKHAYKKYLQGLKDTGISIDSIPDMDTMNLILSKIGWAAVTVDGFIPPSAFMEFQAYNILVIAADIRTIDQIEYTPAPDIIHEAAGHAPIIADKEYAAYLKYFGEIGSKAFSSSADYELYEAIRHLSIIKADPNTPEDVIVQAESDLKSKENGMGIPSEMALIRNLHWWTVEYGLIGTLEDPKIYGAGLLSSIGESNNALHENVIKLPYNIDAVGYNFDITKQQPQLFVTPDFQELTKVLDEFTNRMAFKRGGIEGLYKAIESKTTATCVLSSGLQITGTFNEYLLHQNQIIYFRTEGPTALSANNKTIPGHGKSNHNRGYGTPIGRIKGTKKPPRLLSNTDLEEIGLKLKTNVSFSFESGIRVKGFFESLQRNDSSLLLLTFSDCTVQFGDQILFKPEWGIYDMAVGETIISAYNGPANADEFGFSVEVPKEKTHKIIYTNEQLKLFNLYGEVRKIRDSKTNFEILELIFNTLKVEFINDWLLSIEIAEVLNQNQTNPKLQNEIRNHLKMITQRSPSLKSLIERGLNLV